MPTCPDCGGSKVVTRIVFPPGRMGYRHVADPTAHGFVRVLGSVEDRPCKACGGTGEVPEPRKGVAR